jgi:hypothetical protein
MGLKHETIYILIKPYQTNSSLLLSSFFEIISNNKVIKKIYNKEGRKEEEGRKEGRKEEDLV